MSCLIRYNPAGSILLPQGYTRLAYIEGNADAWFSAGIAATANTKYKIKFSAKNRGQQNMIFGRWPNCDICINSSMHLYINGSYVGVIEEDEICDVTASSSAVYFKSKDSITCNKVSAHVVKLAVFGGTNDGDTNNSWGYGKGRIYELKIWEGNTLIRDYVPAKNSSGVAGLLDLVDNSWHPSSTSTQFKAGPEILQGFPTSEYCQVETHSAVTQTSDVIPCYRRSDGKPGKYTLSTNTFTEVQGTIGPSITFGWGEIINGAVGFPQTSAYDSNIYYEPDGSAWIRVFHHNNPTNNKFSSSDPFTTSFKKNDNMWWDMPKFNQITDDIYDIMVKYKTTSNASEIKHRWVQYTNPMSGTFENTTYNKVTKSYYYGSTIMDNSYGGFYRDTSNNAYIVHNNNTKGNWYGAIGCWKDFSNGIPGPNNTTITSGYVDVYMHIPNHPAIPHNISTGDGRNGEKNGAFDRGHIKTQGLESLKTSNWTIACWLYPLATSSTDGSAFLGLGSTINGALVVESNRYFSYNTSGTARIGNLSLENNKWTHIAFVNNGNTIKYYKNGIYVNEIDSTNIVDTGELWVGSRCFGGEVNCRFQDIQVWDEVKNPAELI